MKTLFPILIAVLLWGCEKTSFDFNEPDPRHLGDSIIVYNDFYNATIIVEIDDGVSKTWQFDPGASSYKVKFPPTTGEPEYIPFRNKHYKAYMREAHDEWIFLEEGIIRVVTMIDGVSWN